MLEFSSIETDPQIAYFIENYQEIIKFPATFGLIKSLCLEFYQQKILAVEAYGDSVDLF